VCQQGIAAVDLVDLCRTNKWLASFSALDTSVTLAYDGPVLKRFYDGLGLIALAAASNLLPPVHSL
jgi:hypothetical protein